MVAVPQAPLQRAAVHSLLPASGPKGGGTLVLLNVRLLPQQPSLACSSVPSCPSAVLRGADACALPAMCQLCVLCAAAMPQVTAARAVQTTSLANPPAQSTAGVIDVGSPREQGDGLTAPASCIFSNGTLDISVSARILNASAASCTAPAWDFSGPGAALSLGLATSTCTLWQVTAHLLLPVLLLTQETRSRMSARVPGCCMDVINA